MEHDRQENRQGCEALAPQWWEFFNFQLLFPLIDTNDSSIFGAVYEFNPKAFNYYQKGIIPKYVIAFRGTTIKKQSVSQDLWLDLNIIKHGLHQSTRFGIAVQAVQQMVSEVGASNVWLAGHSLGSSIAMLVGKNMAKMGNYLDTYLFNTPFIAAPTEKIQHEKVKNGVRFASSLVKAGLTVAMKGTKENRNPDDLFTALAAWVPKLFVNPADLICSEYIGYFEHRDRMEYLGVSGIEKLAMQTSVSGLLKSAIGRESEVIHVVPSAHMTINRSPSLTFMEAHAYFRLFRISFQEPKLKQKMSTSGKLDKKNSFDHIGPVHLTKVDWQSGHHRRSIAASLVQSAYVLEHDRQKNRQGSEALAPQWWEFFNFQLLYPLIDSNDSSIFGAVFEFKAFNYYHTGIIPRYVIAFRGTTIKKHCVAQDLWLDLKIIIHGLHQSTRFGVAMQAVQSMVSAVGPKNIWLAGHSLGSSIAMLVGKNMAKMGNYLDTYLFNTPFIAAPTEKIQHEKVKNGVRFASSLVKAGLTVAMKGTKENRSPDDSFTALATWVPKLFVNPADHICCEYIGYFEHRDRMEYLGVSGIERLATQTSVTGLLKGAIGRESEVIHVVPSAYVTINRCPSPNFMHAHGLQQWLRDDFHMQSKVYQYRL
ncbi:hypothetical protein MKW92_031364 [Papaver armeniacum]|nr:hypothetical protein MKW92_031364 [Papaver armeniacum]